jgi:hypothetical protein
VGFHERIHPDLLPTTTTEPTLASAFSDDEGYVVVLFTRAELPKFVNDGRQQGPGRAFTILLQAFNQPGLSEFLSRNIERFGYSVGIENECISREELTFPNLAIPLLEQTQHRAGGVEAFQSFIGTEEKRGVMATICIA